METTLNILRQATLSLRISEWGYFNGPFDCNTTPLGPLGFHVTIQTKARNENIGVNKENMDSA